MSTNAEPSMGTGQKVIIIILSCVIALLLIAAGFLGYEYFQSRNKIQNQEQQLTELDQKIDTLDIQYEREVFKVDSMLNVITTLEQEKIMEQQVAQQYQMELESLKQQLSSARSNRTPIDNPQTVQIRIELEKKIEELNVWEEKYNALMEENKGLKLSNSSLNNQVTEIKEVNVQLGEENEQLGVQVGLAQKIRSAKAEITGRKVKKNGTRDLETKAKRVDKLMVEVLLAPNKLARGGDKELFFIVTGPNGKIVNQSDDQLFTIKGKQYAYSSHEIVIYQNESLTVTTELSGTGKWEAGEYSVEIYLDGDMIDEATVKLQ